MASGGEYAVIGSIAIALGSSWQMWIETGEQRFRLKSMLEAKDELSEERRKDLLLAQGVAPWNLRKRRAVARIARDESMAVLGDQERRDLSRSDRQGWAWSLVLAGAIVTAIGAAFSL